MKPKILEICKKCPEFVEWASFYDCGLGVKRFDKHEHYGNMVAVQYEAKGEWVHNDHSSVFNPTAFVPIGFKYNEHFEVPDKCPYFLEHTLQ